MHLRFIPVRRENTSQQNAAASISLFHQSNLSHSAIYSARDFTSIIITNLYRAQFHPFIKSECTGKKVHV